MRCRLPASRRGEHVVDRQRSSSVVWARGPRRQMSRARTYSFTSTLTRMSSAVKHAHGFWSSQVAVPTADVRRPDGLCPRGRRSRDRLVALRSPCSASPRGGRACPGRNARQCRSRRCPAATRTASRRRPLQHARVGDRAEGADRQLGPHADVRRLVKLRPRPSSRQPIFAFQVDVALVVMKAMLNQVASM
jgi:hypothetical protein